MTIPGGTVTVIGQDLADGLFGGLRLDRAEDQFLQANHRYFAKISSMIFLAMGFCDAKNK